MQPGGLDARQDVHQLAGPATNSSVGSEKPFSVTSPIWSKRRWAPAASSDRARDEHLAARGARGDARREVDRAAVVVAVAVERGAGVDPDPRARPRVRGERLVADRPVGERARVGADDHHLVADRLDHARVVGQRDLDAGDEPLDDVERLLLPRLLGQPRVAREVGERDRDAQAPEVDVALGLHVADDVLLDEVAQEPPVQPVHHRRGEREQASLASVSISSAISRPGTPSRISGSCT